MPDIADVRLANALLLRDHWVRKWQAADQDKEKAKAKTPEASFAALIGINASYWSQLKARHRHIPGKLARQIERQCDLPPESLDSEGAAELPGNVLPNTVQLENDDEKHAVRLFLIAYRLNAQAARERILQVLDGEALKATTNEASKKTTAGARNAATLRRRA